MSFAYKVRYFLISLKRERFMLLSIIEFNDNLGKMSIFNFSGKKRVISK